LIGYSRCAQPRVVAVRGLLTMAGKPRAHTDSRRRQGEKLTLVSTGSGATGWLN
jgi:hypothetical protein